MDTTGQQLLNLGFDRYQRFKAASDIIRELAAGRQLSILEMGAFDNALAPFLAGFQHTCWPEKVDRQNPLAMADKQVDITLALDVLEHVLPEEREFFIQELSRVARQALILSFPVKTSEAAETFVGQMTGSAWLKEHQALGLPDKSQAEAMFARLNLKFTCYPNGALPSWTAMMLLMHGVEPDLRARISNFFNRHYYQLENREPAYRYLYVLTRSDKVKGFLSPKNF